MAKIKQNRIIGFVLDSAELQAVELSGSFLHPVVNAFGSCPLAPGLVTDGVVQDTAAVAESLKQLLHDHDFTTKQLLVGMKDSSVLLRTANFPQVSEDKLRGVVLYQAQQFIPIPVSDLVLDYIPLGETTVEERPMTTVLLVGAKKTCLHSVMDVVQKAGLRVLEVDSALLATSRSIVDSSPFEAAPFLMVQLDSEMISFALVKDGLVIMTRSIALPAALVELLAGCKGQPLDDAGCQNAAMALQGDLTTSISFFSTQADTLVEKIYLVGQYPSLGGIATALAQQTQLDVALPVLYPELAGIDTLTYGSCIALALRGLEAGAL